MSGRVKHRKQRLARVLIGFGVHIWLLIFLSNIVVFFAFRFFLMASSPDTGDINTNTMEPTASISAGLSSKVPLPTQGIPVSTPRPSPTPTPIGPVVGLNFSLPGISSVGGNIKPLHLDRDVNIYIYNPDVNTADINVKPLFTLKAKAVYDDNTASPTYTSFVNNYIDLGKDIIDNSYYQLAYKTPQSLMQLVKDPSSSSVGGKIFRLARNNPTSLPHQEMISGDIYPVPYSDNFMDINDYNMLVNCHGSKASTSECISGSLADLDDNGVIDGTDYNIMVLSFQILKDKGLPIPNISTPNKIIINPYITNPLDEVTLPVSSEEKPTPSPTIIQQTKSANSGGGGLLIVIIFLMIVLGVAVFASLKFHLLDKILKKEKKPAENSQPPSDAGSAPDTSVQTPVGSEETQAEVADKTEAGDNQPVPDASPVSPTASDTPAQEPQITEKPVEPANQTTPPATDVIEKSGFVKKVSADAEKNGTWITLADDSGITRGFYKGTNVVDGFAKIKGTMKTDAENKQYIEITDLTPEE